MKRTGSVGEQINSTEVDDIHPAWSVVFQLRVVGEAKVDHAQHVNALDVDRQISKLIGSKRHELQYVVHLQNNTAPLPTYVGKPSAVGQPTRPTQPWILSGSID